MLKIHLNNCLFVNFTGSVVVMSDIETMISHETVALSQYEIVRRIFSSLSMPDIYRLASVCKIWLEVSVRARQEKSRLKPVFFCWRAPLRPIGFYNNYDFPNSPGDEFSVVFILSKLGQIVISIRFNFKRSKRNCYVCFD